MTKSESLVTDSDFESSGSTNVNNSPRNSSSGTSVSNVQINGSKSASDQYQRLSQLEHILKRPDTYIGSVEMTHMEMWCLDMESESVNFREVKIVPGLYKIFDEILVNAADNKIRDPTMRNIKVTIDAENNIIEVMNDGKGIPVEIHTKENMYIPELIFGNLLTSSNYDDDEKKVTGGRNGYGAKLCNIFSTEFILETADASHESVYKQTWSNNMSQVLKPKISKMRSSKEYTKIRFKPDLSKFGMTHLDDDILSVIRRRVYDLCGTVRNCNIYLNDKKLPIKNFKNYVDMYVKAIQQRSGGNNESSVPEGQTTIAHENINERWEVAFALSDGSFNQVSFVNSIATTSGGTHVKYIADQITTKLSEVIHKKLKSKNLKFKAQDIKNNMFLFINCLIENPSFNSQTKEQLTTRTGQFAGSAKHKITISDLFINKILKTGILEKIEDIADTNLTLAMQKADGSKKLRIKNQVKLVDANKAGTKKGHECTLILTEGDSALSLAVAGLAVIGRDYYGCFPLKGKLLNVREASVDQISKNAEIKALKQIMGLKHGKHYTIDDISTLRYGHIMIMTDQDQDGSHIKGLIINFLDVSFPGLLQIPGFLLEFITPIVKVTIRGRGGSKTVMPFYTMPQFEKWRETEGTTCRWSHKYYKGLGTSTPVETREYFAALDKHLKRFHALQTDERQYIDLAFSKKKADDRKDWLQAFEPGTHLDPELEIIPIGDFINKELILFSMADNVRSIPSILDGFKPGQRKVLFACFKRNLKTEIKVSQLQGYVSERTGYHHGEAALAQTIIGLAQDFIGSNNLNLLSPNGSFGSRAAGGKDFSAPRYIFTELNKITRTIFNPLDDALYRYLQEDEQTVEPEWYLPVLPMILVNGTEGIGTGWSTNIPQFNPKDIVDNIRRLMNGEEMLEMAPWYRGWEGEIEKESSSRYKVKGRIEQIDDTTLEISEIPAKVWTNNVKEFLLNAMNNEKEKPWIKDFEEQHGVNLKFVVKLSPEEMQKSLHIGLLQRFKLISSVSLSNMVAFDPQGRIKKYSSPLEILQDYFYIRLEYYQKRKDYIADKLQNQLIRLSEQARFIKLIIDKELTVSNRKRIDLAKQLESLNFTKLDKDGKPSKETTTQSLMVDPDELIEEQEETQDISQLNTGEIDDAPQENEHIPETIYTQYDYLLGMSIWSLTRERYEKLLRQKEEKNDELMAFLSKSPKDLWNDDLDQFLDEWNEFLRLDFIKRSDVIPSKPTTGRKRGRATTKSLASKKAKTIKPKKTEENTPTDVDKKTPQIKDEPDESLPTFFGSNAPKVTSKQKSKPRRSMFDSSDDEDIYSLPKDSQEKKPNQVTQSSILDFAKPQQITPLEKKKITRPSRPTVSRKNKSDNDYEGDESFIEPSGSSDEDYQED